jgi:hypothetical protein
MGLNIIELPYLIFRLAPIIIVSFFIFQSFLLWDIKGVLYICGLILTCGVTLLANSGLNIVLPILSDTNKNPKCRTITLGENGEYYSNIPLNLVVYSFTFFYLLIFIFNLANPNSTVGILDTSTFTQSSINNALQQNIPILIFFPLLILVELFWINVNSCVSTDIKDFVIYTLSGIIIGGVGGMVWALLITSIGVPQLQYIISGNNSVCSRPSKTLFRCKPKLST